MIRLWKKMVFVILISVAIVDALKCYKKENVAKNGNNVSEFDKVECKREKDTCFVVEYQREGTTLRDYGCFDGDEKNACPTRREKKTKDRCMMSNSYSTTELSEGQHTVKCNKNCFIKNEDEMKYSDIVHCHDGVVMSEKQYNNDAKAKSYIQCNITSANWTDEVSVSPNALSVMVGKELVTRSRRFHESEVLKINCKDDDIVRDWKLSFVHIDEFNHVVPMPVKGYDKYACVKKGGDWTREEAPPSYTLLTVEGKKVVEPRAYKVGEELTISCLRYHFANSGIMWFKKIITVAVVKHDKDNSVRFKYEKGLYNTLLPFKCTKDYKYFTGKQISPEHLGIKVNVGKVSVTEARYYATREELTINCLDNYHSETWTPPLDIKLTTTEPVVFKDEKNTKTFKSLSQIKCYKTVEIKKGEQQLPGDFGIKVTVGGKSVTEAREYVENEQLVISCLDYFIPVKNTWGSSYTYRVIKPITKNDPVTFFKEYQCRLNTRKTIEFNEFYAATLRKKHQKLIYGSKQGFQDVPEQHKITADDTHVYVITCKEGYEPSNHVEWTSERVSLRLIAGLEDYDLADLQSDDLISFTYFHSCVKQYNDCVTLKTCKENLCNEPPPETIVDTDDNNGGYQLCPRVLTILILSYIILN